MRITKIHLFNFRSVENLTLDVAEDGLHALIGPFGSGKSSFLTGVRFALFGDNGDAGANVDIRRRGCPEGQEAGCEVTFIQGQDTFVARRWLRRTNTKSKGAVEKTHASLTVNGRPVDGVTARTLTKEMEDVLGMNARAFTSASMIPQGEVATLMKATPTEVQALIEEHTGLDQVTRQRDTTRKQAREAEVAAEALPGDAETVNELEVTLEQATQELQAATSMEENARADLDAVEVRARRAEEVVTELQRRQQAAMAHENRVVAARERVKSADDALDALRQEANDLGVGLDFDSDAARASMEQLDRELQDIADTGRALTHARAHTAQVEGQAADGMTRARQAEHRIAELDDELNQLQQQVNQCTNQLVELAAQSNDATARQATALAESSRLGKAITTLRNDHGSGHCCPTCQQHVEDHAGLIESLAVAQRNADAQAQAIGQELHELRTRENTTKNAIQQATAAGRSLERERVDNLRAVDRATELTAQVAASQEKEKQARAAMRKLMEHTHQQAATMTDDELLELGRVVHKNLRHQQNRIAAAQGLYDRHQQATRNAQNAMRDLEQLTEKHVGAPTEQDFNTAHGALADLRARLADARARHQQATTELASQQSVHAMVKLQYDTARCEWESKCEAVRTARTLRGEADVLTAFRADLLADYTNSICRSASDLLASFGGEYVAFHLGEDFVPRAELADGTLVRTNILSGGESAMVGLAFRIGITLEITGGGMPDQIIGDEVTNYLDEDGRRAVLTALNSIFPSVLLISHTAEAEDYATRVHRVHREPLQPTQWANVDYVADPAEVDAA